MPIRLQVCANYGCSHTSTCNMCVTSIEREYHSVFSCDPTYHPPINRYHPSNTRKINHFATTALKGYRTPAVIAINTNAYDCKHAGTIAAHLATASACCYKRARSPAVLNARPIAFMLSTSSQLIDLVSSTLTCYRCFCQVPGVNRSDA